MAKKQQQPHLNGAFYGPSIPPPSPPPTQTFHRHGRGSGCGCGCCLINLLLKLIFTVIVLIGLAVLIFWLIFRPNMVKFHVTDAKLTQFTHTNNTLNYNLTLNLEIRNPNRRIGIYYDEIEARSYYKGQRFDSVMLNPFFQGHKNTSDLETIMEGQQLVVLGSKELKEFDAETSSGVYSIDLKVYLKIRFKVWRTKTGKFRPRFDCPLKIPLSGGNGTVVIGSGAFQRTKCEVDF